MLTFFGRVDNIIHTVAAQIFTHLSVVSGRQRLYGRLRCEGKIKWSKTMTDNEIFQLAEKFRNAILRTNANGEFFRDGFIELFSRGNCWIVYNLLVRYFLEYDNVRSWYTSRENKSESHVWLTLENGSIEWYYRRPVQQLNRDAALWSVSICMEKSMHFISN